MKYEKKENYLKKAKFKLNQNYFDKDEPLVSDNDFDDLLKKDILNLEKNMKF